MKRFSKFVQESIELDESIDHNQVLVKEVPNRFDSSKTTHQIMHSDKKIISSLKKNASDHAKKHLAGAYRDGSDIVHKASGKTMANIKKGTTMGDLHKQVHNYIDKNHPQKADSTVKHPSNTRSIVSASDEHAANLKNKFHGKDSTVRIMKRKEGNKVYIDSKNPEHHKTVVSKLNSMHEAAELDEKYKDPWAAPRKGSSAWHAAQQRKKAERDPEEVKRVNAIGNKNHMVGTAKVTHNEAAELSHENLNSIAKDHDNAAKKHSTAYKETRSTAAARSHEAAYNRHSDAAKAHREAANDKSKHSSEKLEKMSNHAWDATDHTRKHFDEEVSLDEVSDKKLDAYRQKAFADQPAGDDGSNKYRKRKFGRDLAFAKQTGRAKVLATKEEVSLDEVSTEKLRDYASAALQDKNKAKADKRWKYAGKAMQKVADREVKAAHARKYNKMESVELDEASTKVEIPKSRYETILKMHGPKKTVRTPKGEMQYRGAEYFKHDKATNTHITQTYSHPDHKIAAVEKHTHGPSGKITHYMYKKQKSESVELDEETQYEMVESYLLENNIDVDTLSVEQLDEIIGKVVGGAFKLGAKAAVGAARRMSTSGRADAAEKRANAAEKRNKDRERIETARQRLRDAQKAARETKSGATT